MALEKSARPLAKSLRCTRHDRIALPIRAFSSSAPSQQETETAPQSTRPPIDPLTVHNPRLERKLTRETKQYPVGSRRRRAALATSPDIPFAELPYQCFQEALKFLKEDREERLKEIAQQRLRISNLQDKVVVGASEEAKKEHRLKSMRTYLEELKIHADINDPIVKKKFEDGQADMKKPIYRHLADKKWREYERKLLMQRLEQMDILPDVLPKIDPIVSTTLSFASPSNPKSRRNVPHGDFVDSRISEHAPQLNVQPYQKGDKLYTIAVINPDVPNVEKDGFDYRCHFLACNVKISPVNTLVHLGKLSEENQVVIPWLPAYSQKGFPYQRMSILVFEQPPSEKPRAGSSDVPPSKVLDIQKIKTETPQFAQTDNFNARNLMGRFRLQPVGADLFRTQYDEGTAGVMRRAGIPGWDVEFKRKRIEPLPYKRLKEERYR